MSNAEGYIKWLYKKMKLNNYAQKYSKKLNNWKIYRGQIYTCFLGENIGYEKSKQEARPCVVISSNLLNASSGNVIVVPLSKDIKYKDGTHKLKYPFHFVLYRKKYPKLNFDSAVQCEDIRCVSKARLATYICNVTSDDIKEINKRIKISLQL